MDMVCEQDSTSSINMEQEGLELAVDGDEIYAKGTTLGADDGIAVAYALALLDSSTLQHPRLEFVCTVAEEVGMDGARALDISPLQGRQLLNLDSEDEGIALAGCAGGGTALLTLPLNRASLTDKEKYLVPVEIGITGLLGGHSGSEIDKGRANADYELAEVLQTLKSQMEYRLLDFSGGNKDNAIPREAMASIYVQPEDKERLQEMISKINQRKQQKYALTDPEYKIVVTIGKENEKVVPEGINMLSENSTTTVVDFIVALPNGVQEMSLEVEGLVQTSLNLGKVRIHSEEAKLSLVYSLRSSKGVSFEKLSAQVNQIATQFQAAVKYDGIYPAWEYVVHSPLRDRMCLLYEQKYHKKMTIEVIHAGLECGLLAGKLKELDAVSIGPDMKDIHTTQERLSISSTKRVYDFLVQFIEKSTN